MKYCGVKPLKYNGYFITTVDSEGPSALAPGRQ